MKIFQKTIATLLTICMMFTVLPQSVYENLSLDVFAADVVGTSGYINSNGIVGKDGGYMGEMPYYVISLMDTPKNYNDLTNRGEEAVVAEYRDEWIKIDDYAIQSLFFVPYDGTYNGKDESVHPLNEALAYAHKGDASHPLQYIGVGYYTADGRIYNDLNLSYNNVPIRKDSGQSRNYFYENVMAAYDNKSITSIADLSNGGWRKYIDNTPIATIETNMNTRMDSNGYKYSVAVLGYLLGDDNDVDGRIERFTNPDGFNSSDIKNLTARQKLGLAAGYVGLLANLYNIAEGRGLTGMAGKYEAAINNYCSNSNNQEAPVTLGIEKAYMIQQKNADNSQSVFSLKVFDYMRLYLLTNSAYDISDEAFIKLNYPGAAGSTKEMMTSMLKESVKQNPLSKTAATNSGYIRRIADNADKHSGNPKYAGALGWVQNAFQFTPKERHEVQAGNNIVYRGHGGKADGILNTITIKDGTDLYGFMIVGNYVATPPPKVSFSVDSTVQCTQDVCSKDVQPTTPAKIRLTIDGGANTSGLLEILNSRIENNEISIPIEVDIKRTVYRDSIGNVHEGRVLEDCPELEKGVALELSGQNAIDVLSGQTIELQDTKILEDLYTRDESSATVMIYKYDVDVNITIDGAKYEYKSDDIVLKNGSTPLNYASFQFKAYATPGTRPEPVPQVDVTTEKWPSDFEGDIENWRNGPEHWETTAMVKTYEYTSQGSAFAEIKSNQPLKEKYEVLGGIPSSEELYFSVGGSEFKVAMVLQYWMNQHSRDRTYHIHFEGNTCEYNNQEKGKGDSWEGIDLPIAEGATMTTTRFEHADTSDPEKSTKYPDGLSNNKKYGTITVTATWEGQIINDAVPVYKENTQLHSATVLAECPAQPNHDAYLEAVGQANAWMKAMADLSTNSMKWKAASDQVERFIVIEQMDMGTGGSDLTQAAKGSGSDNFTWGNSGNNDLTTGSYSYEFENPADTSQPGSASVGCSKSKDTPCGNEQATAKATANPDTAKPYKITVTYTIKPHVLCGPCCGHVMPDIWDMWKQGLIFDYAKISQIRLFKLDQGSVDGLEELTGINGRVFANVVSGNPTYFMNIAQQTASNYDKATGTVNMPVKYTDPDKETFKEFGYVNYLPMNKSELTKDNHNQLTYYSSDTRLSQSSRAGRIRYILAPGESNVNIPITEQGNGKGGSYTLDKERMVATWQHDDVFYELSKIPNASTNGGRRSMNCDGMASTNNFGKLHTNNSIPTDDNKVGHENDWADGILYTNILGFSIHNADKPDINVYSATGEATGSGVSGVFSNYWKTDSFGNSFSPLEMMDNDTRALCREVKANPSGPGATANTYFEDYDHHGTLHGFDMQNQFNIEKKKGYYCRSDAKDRETAEWKFIDAARKTKVVANVISDFLILQTSGGDQSIFYYEKATEPTEVQAHFKKLDITEEEIFDQNPLSVFNKNSDVCVDTDNGALKKANLVDLVTVGGYNGQYNNPTKKYLPYSTVENKYYSFPKDGQFTYDAHNKSGTYNIYGGSTIKTIFDTGAGGGDPARTISRPKRQATSQDTSFKVIQDNIRILPTAPNKLYTPEDARVWYSQVEGFYSTDIGYWNTEKDMMHVGTIGNVSIGNPQKNEHGEDYKINWGNEVGVEEGAKYFSTPDGNGNSLTVNNIVVYTPVSTEDAMILEQGDLEIGSVSVSRDQRVDNSLPNMNDMVNKLKVCPLDPAECEYRVLNCRYHEPQVLAQFNFEDTYEATEQQLIDGEFKNVTVTKQNTYMNGSTLITTNILNGIEYQLPTGFSKSNGKLVANGGAGTRWTIPFADIGLSNSANNTIQIDMDLTVNSGSLDKMVVGLHNVGLLITNTNNAETSLISRSLLDNTKPGVQLDSTFNNVTNVTNAKVSLKLCFNNIEDSEVTINGNKASVEVFSEYKKTWTTEIDENGNEFRTQITEVVELEDLAKEPPSGYKTTDIGTNINIGCWGQDNAYGANFTMDNLKITLLGGSTEHTSACYETVITHSTKKVHVCDENCYTKEDMYLCNGVLNSNYQLGCGKEEGEIDVTNETSRTYSYTGKTQAVTLAPGKYILETWGAQGGAGAYSSAGGKGGYSVGTITLDEVTTLYVNVGGAGSTGSSSTTYEGGWNGGGQSYYYAGSGGGATDISLKGTVNTTTWNSTDHLYSRIIVAGGGGGTQRYSTSYTGGQGGYGGGLTGGSATCGSNWGYTNSQTGGSQTAGGYGNYLGSFGYGYQSYGGYQYVGGAGGGWYGGAAGTREGYGGSGGSGYVYTADTKSNYPSGCLLSSDYYLTDAQTVGGNESFVNVAGSGYEDGHSGNGAAKITVVEGSNDGKEGFVVDNVNGTGLGTEYTYSTNGIQTVTLPAGRYKLEVWGAQGGAFNYHSNAAAGKGGYSSGIVTFDTQTTLYIGVGGKGTDNSWRGAGGYNGGGQGSAPGGGATHIATATGTLSSLKNNTDAILIVAGGGAGSCGRYAGGNGGSAITAATAGTRGCGTAGGAGTTSSGGTSGSCGTAGTFGQGGTNSCSGGGTDSGSGGGGGYYGGGAGGHDHASPLADDSSGGGGSGYAKSTLSDVTGSTGVRTGNGLAKITPMGHIHSGVAGKDYPNGCYTVPTEHKHIKTEKVLICNKEYDIVGLTDVYTFGTGGNKYNSASGSTSLTLQPGRYKLEVWGAQGAQYSGTPGKGGYSVGEIELDTATTVYVYVGGQGSGTTGGFNGGGTGNGHGYGGGGGTDIRIGGNTLYHRVIVAGGGGGSQAYFGGDGGGTSGIHANSGCGSNAGPGTQTTGYAFGEGGPALRGSDGYYGGAGGGGWYGGYGGQTDHSRVDDMGGSGGSGYVYTASTVSNYPSGCKLNSNYYLTNARTVVGNTSFPNTAGTGNETGHSGDGFAKITGLTKQVEHNHSEDCYMITNGRLICGIEEDEDAGTVYTFGTGGNTFTSASGSTSMTLPAGTYDLEVWGAQGGGGYDNTSYTSVGGKGGYSKGTITLVQDTPIYVYVGGVGSTDYSSSYRAGGFNGGGYGTAYAGAGGGGSDIRIGTNSIYSRVIVAGGGGGSTRNSNSNIAQGGYGGGTSGGYAYSNGQWVGTGYYAGPGTQTGSISSNYRTGYEGSFGSAYTSYYSSYCGGGGGGWYGGGNGNHHGIGGAGGSGYVYTASTASNYPSGCTLNSSYFLTDAQTYAGNTSFSNTAGTANETGHSGNGFVKITSKGHKHTQNCYGQNYSCGKVESGTLIGEYSLTNSTITVPLSAGTYKLEVWGAEGGSAYQTSGYTALGGKGGYSVGYLTLDSANTAYVTVGGKGTNNNNYGGASAGGYNGGGAGYYCAGGGGGATDIRLGDTAISNRIIVAGGGGGGSAYSSYTSLGGYGGGTIGGSGVGHAYWGTSHTATGGTQSSGGTGSYWNYAGSLGSGGTQSSDSYTGGGGGGYYGGAAGTYHGYSGAGGSGYVSSTLKDAQTLNGNSLIPTISNYNYNYNNYYYGYGNTVATEVGHSGNGYARIYKIDHHHDNSCYIYGYGGGYICGKTESVAGTPIEFAYTGSVQPYTLPEGKYKLEVWGAQGGRGGLDGEGTTVGGKGGYSVGELNISDTTDIYVYVGGGGSGGYGTSGSGTSFNGGGIPGSHSDNYWSAGGGGTDIRLLSDSLYSRVIVAGGGDGVGSPYADGGAGGGESGIAGGIGDSSYSSGTVGTQTAGGTTYSGYNTITSHGSFGSGGRTSGSHANGGGGGWYGGGASGPHRGGAGGSGYVLTSSSTKPTGYLLGSEYYLTNASTTAGNQSFLSPTGTDETGHSGNGYARITPLEGHKHSAACLGGGVQDFEYTGEVETVTLGPGTHILETWGAQGGSYVNTGGKGGYSIGTLNLTETTTVYIRVGGQGANGNSTSSNKAKGGFNGGGNGGSSGANGSGSAGGGGSDIRIGTDDVKARVIVAGGGGGAGCYSGGDRNGGAGGGEVGLATGSESTSKGRGGGAGTQTAGGATSNSKYTGAAGSFGQGGNGYTGSAGGYGGGGGGGGWYGGGSGGTGASSTSNGGGGGGSGYVYTVDTASNYPSGCLLDTKYYLTDAETIAGDQTFLSPDGTDETGHTGDGHIRITSQVNDWDCKFIPAGTFMCTGELNTVTDFNAHEHTEECLLDEHQVPPATFTYTETVQTYVIPYTDYYTLETYGPHVLGQGGYAKATYHFKQGTRLYIYVGSDTYNDQETDIRIVSKPGNQGVAGEEGTYNTIVQNSNNSRLVRATSRDGFANNFSNYTATNVETGTRGTAISGMATITCHNSPLSPTLDDIVEGNLTDEEVIKHLGPELFDMITNNASVFKTYSEFSIDDTKGVVSNNNTGVFFIDDNIVLHSKDGNTASKFYIRTDLEAETLRRVRITLVNNTSSTEFKIAANNTPNTVSATMQANSTNEQVITFNVADAWKDEDISILYFLPQTKGGGVIKISKIELIGHATFVKDSSGYTNSNLLTLSNFSADDTKGFTNISNTSISYSGNKMVVTSTGSNPQTQWTTLNSMNTSAIKAIKLVFTNKSSSITQGRLYYKTSSASWAADNAFMWYIGGSSAGTQTVWIDTASHTAYNETMNMITTEGSGWSGTINNMRFDWSELTSGNIEVSSITFYGNGSTTGTGSYSSALTCNITEGTSNYAKTFNYTGGIQTDSLPSGRYKLEVWGAQGGDDNWSGGSNHEGGYGGYSYGEITFNSTQKLYIVVGGKGVNSSSSGEGYNGGGKATGHGSSGGGATHIATATGKLSELSNNTSSILIVAGGGGGLDYGGSWERRGGDGGGGTQLPTAGLGVSQATASSGYSFGQGQAVSGQTGGGGGGYYGGYCGINEDQGSGRGSWGGGGSAYLKSTLTNKGGSAGVNTGDGYAKITGLSHTHSDSCYTKQSSPVTITSSSTSKVYYTATYNNPLTRDNVKQTIIDNYLLIPDYVDGDYNPLWLCRFDKLNVHLCVTKDGEQICKITEILKCNEPHHRKVKVYDENGQEIGETTEHYPGTNDICWDACGNDENHKLTKTQTELSDGSNVRLAEFLQLDEGFTVYFPNRGDFYGNGALGLSAPQVTRGYGYKNNMDTTNWTREKRVRFPFDVIYEGELYNPKHWIELDVEQEVFNFYLPVSNPEMSNVTVEFEVEAINCGTTDGVEVVAGISYDNVVNETYANALEVFIKNYMDNWIDAIKDVDGYKMPYTEPRRETNSSDVDEPGLLEFEDFGYLQFYLNKMDDEDDLEDAINTINEQIQEDFEGTNNNSNIIYPHEKDGDSINNLMKPRSVNDNKTRISNIQRRSSYQSLHGGYKFFYMDVIGRIGNFAITDTEDYKFSNFFKWPTLKSGDTEDTRNWLVEGLVMNVDEGIQNYYIGDTYDIRGYEAKGNTLNGNDYGNLWLDTYGTQTWMRGEFLGENGEDKDNYPNVGEVTLPDNTKIVRDRYDTSIEAESDQRDLTKPNLYSQILAGDVNNIEVLKEEEMQFGYDIFTSIVTFGNYQNGRVQVVPKYYALKLTGDEVPNVTFQAQRNEYIPLDVYISRGGSYVAVNIFGNAGNGQKNIGGYELDDYAFNLDWTVESHRRNYSLEEQARTKRICDSMKQYIYNIEDIDAIAGDGQFVSDNFELLRIEEAERPQGMNNYLGTSQYMLMTGQHRTFIGSSNTYGNNIWVGPDETTQFGVKENGKYTASKLVEPAEGSARLSEKDFERAVQRWHGKLGVPSSSVFVPHGEAVNADTIKYVMNDSYAIICTAEIIVMGTTWNLAYSQPWFNTLTIDDSEYSTYQPGAGDGHYPGHRKENGTPCKDCPPPIIAVYSSEASSVDDIEIVASH